MNQLNPLHFHDYSPKQESFAHALIAGLSQPRRAVPCRFLYDARGSRLFEQITELEEYYPTRTEIGVLEAHADEIAAKIGPDAALLEFGAGSSRKAEILLATMDRPAAYAPIDVSPTALQASADQAAARFPKLAVQAVCADYGQPFDLPRLPGVRKVGFFPGSTIGNLTPDEAQAFLNLWRARLGVGGAMIVGVDLKKDPAILAAAYDDPQGVTAAFSLNVLMRANAELGADFDLNAFRHEAFYDAQTGCVAIHLVSQRAQTAHVEGSAFTFSVGERVHVEDSWKYSVADFQELARRAGFAPEQAWTDAKGLFSVHYLAA